MKSLYLETRLYMRLQGLAYWKKETRRTVKVSSPYYHGDKPNGCHFHTKCLPNKEIKQETRCRTTD